jgi:hypothetical protein
MADMAIIQAYSVSLNGSRLINHGSKVSLRDFRASCYASNYFKKICPQPTPIFYILNTGTWIRIPNVDADPEGK